MDKFLEVLPIIGSLLMIVLILLFTYYATRWYAKRMGPSIAGKNIRIVDKAVLSNTSSLVIAEVCGKYYLLGVAEHGITLLKELEGFEAKPPEEPPASFQALFTKLLGKIGGNNAAKEKDNNSEDDGEPQ